MVKNIITALIISLLVTCGYAAIPKESTAPTQLGGNGIETVRQTFAGGLQISNNNSIGTPVTMWKAGTCALSGADTAQAASTTAVYDCSVIGVKNGDTVIGAIFGSSTPFLFNTSPGWAIVSARASTTNGFITFGIANFTGRSAALSGTGRLASTTNYEVIRSVAY